MTSSNNESVFPKDNFIKHEILTGLAQYAFVHKPDPGNIKKKIVPAYKIDLMFDNKKQLERAKELGLTIKDKDDKHPHPFVTMKSKVAPGRKPPRVVDSKKTPIPGTILIGNGSLVNVRFIPLPYNDGESVTAILQEVQVVKLVEYKPTEGEKTRKTFIDEVEGGFTVPTDEVTA